MIKIGDNMNNIKVLLKKMDRAKRDDGSYNKDILTLMPEIEAFIRSLETITLDEFCLLQAGVDPVPIN